MLPAMRKRTVNRMVTRKMREEKKKRMWPCMRKWTALKESWTV